MAQKCNYVILRIKLDLIENTQFSRGLSAVAELLVFTSAGVFNSLEPKFGTFYAPSGNVGTAKAKT